MKKLIAVCLILTATALSSQVSNFSEKFELPEEVKETSGLLFINNKIITHNDSGGDAKLYEVDNVSGVITRTVTITNAINVDWEDIAEDDTHIYIGDIGNNNGDRTDLTIYKILKTGYARDNTVTAEIIRYSYEDQTDFSSQPNASNFDAEAIAIYQGNIIIFTKNWINLKTNSYIIPKTSGTHLASKTSTYNADGLITGVSYNEENNSFMLVGYSKDDLTPFIVYIDKHRNTGDDVFNGGAQKTLLTDELGHGNQVEGIVHLDNLNYYISREKVSGTVSGIPIVIKQKVFKFSFLTPTTWEGDDQAFPTDWSVAENWSGGIPTLSSDITIPNVANKPVIKASTGACSNNIVIDAEAFLTIDTGGSLNIGSNLTNNGVFTIFNSASLLVSGTATGNITYALEVSDTNWHLLSSPVIDEQYNDAWITANNITISNNNNRGVSRYDNKEPDVTTSYWRYYAGGTTETFNSGIGFALKRNTSGNLVFIGTFPTGDFSVPISQNDNNWNLIGNPYPSYLDISAFIAANTTNISRAFQALYVWDGIEYTSLTTGYIHPGQAFFISSNVQSGSAGITEAMQSHQTGITFYKEDAVTITLKLSDETNSKETQINYIDGKTIGLDPGFDIGMFDGAVSDFSFYTHLVDDSEDTSFERQALPNSDFETMIIPVGLKAAVGKEITFSAEALNLPKGLKVFLEDRETNTFARLDETNGLYRVTLSEALNGLGRFYLHTSASALSTSTISLENVSIYKLDNATLRITGVQNSKTNVTLFTVLGKQVLNTAFQSNGVSDIYLPKLASGVYIVQLKTASGQLNKKIILE